MAVNYNFIIDYIVIIDNFIKQVTIIIINDNHMFIVSYNHFSYNVEIDYFMSIAYYNLNDDLNDNFAINASHHDQNINLNYIIDEYLNTYSIINDHNHHANNRNYVANCPILDSVDSSNPHNSSNSSDH